MKKTTIIMCVVAITVILAGCKKDNIVELQTAQLWSSPTASASAIHEVKDSSTEKSVSEKTDSSLTEETKKQPYSITTATFNQDNIKVQYPQITGLGDNSKEKIINDLIKNDVLNSQVDAPTKFYQDGSDSKDILTLDLKYQVTMNTNELLSVIYTGVGKIKGSAFPTKAIYAITIDLKHATKLEISDFTAIDTNLAQKIKQSTAVTNEAVISEMDKNNLIREIQNDGDQTLIKGLKEKWAYYTFYVTPNSLVVSMAISHAGGDYALIELPGPYTKTLAETKTSDPIIGEKLKDQSFKVNFENLGNCEFISTIEKKSDIKNLPHFYIQNGDSVTELKYGLEWFPLLDSVSSVSFRDVDGDGRKDIIVIVNFYTGAGQMGAIPFSQVVIFKQTESGFAQDKVMEKKAREGIPYRILSIQDVLIGLKTDPKDRVVNAWRRLQPGRYSNGSTTLEIKESNGNALLFSLETSDMNINSGEANPSYEDMIFGEGDAELSFYLMTNSEFYVYSKNIRVKGTYSLTK